ncbi:heterokaryon incompatibility protein [Halenospora varia]|nr:heterokaryon incompatibility protein [Halenospora varia]
MDTEPIFKYAQSPLLSPATSIRLIELLPPREGGPDNTTGVSTLPIYCRIFSASTAFLPKFKALSYSWGTSSQRVRIEISGRDGEPGGLFITPSLELALQHLRHSSESTIIWIDQICINQEDDQEKGEQVPLMCQIYTQAEEVLVWLGLVADDSDSLMDVWQEVGQEIADWGLESYYTKERFSQLGEIVALVNSSDEKTISFHKICKSAAKKFDIKAMAAWYRREWFSRVWIIQEFCLGARTVFICGEKRVHIDLVRYARQVWDFSARYWKDEKRGQEETQCLVEVQADATQSLFVARSRRRKFECNSGTGDSLFQLLQKNHIGVKKGATNPRDRIYGILALSNDMAKLDIRVDYKNSTTEQIYTSTALAIIQAGDLDLLRLVQFPKYCNLLPSWVPDWRGTLYPCFSTVTPNATQLPLFNSSGSSNPSLISMDETSLLGVEGYLVDEIEDVGSPWFVPDDARQKIFPIYDDPQRKYEAFWRIPIGDVEDTVSKAICRATSSFYDGYKSNIALFEAFQEIKLATTVEEMAAIFMPSEEHQDAATRYRGRMYAMRDKRPYISTKGYVGMGPVTTKPGDIIVILIGAQVPFILRPRGRDRFFLLGESYCDGVMDGEMVTRRSKQEFTLV